MTGTEEMGWKVGDKGLLYGRTPVTVAEAPQKSDWGQVAVSVIENARTGSREAVPAEALTRPPKASPPKDKATPPPPKAARKPKPKPIDPERLTTASILDDVFTFLTDYVVFSSLNEAVAVALWVMHTYIVNEFDSTPRLTIRAPQKQSGKTRLIECLKELCHCPMMTVGITTSGLFRSIDQSQVTVLLDEADTVSTGSTSDHKELQGAIDTGHRKGSVYTRCQGAELVPTPFKVFCPVAIAGIGNPPDPILDRSIIVNQRRRTRSEIVQPWRIAAGTKRAKPIVARLTQWAEIIHKQIDEPTMPDGIVDRPADVWAPLLSIAELAGDEWRSSARAACLAMTGAWAAEGGDDLAIMLLRDLRSVFGTDERLPTEKVLMRLMALPESPWREIEYGQGLNDIRLARLLKPYGIKPKSYRDGPKTPRGYLRGMFTDAWTRYLDPVEVR